MCAMHWLCVSINLAGKVHEEVTMVDAHAWFICIPAETVDWGAPQSDRMLRVATSQALGVCACEFG